jgi:hypothetical protein
MAIVWQWKLRTNSNDSVGGFNGTDTSITYSAIWPISWAATFNTNTDKIEVADNAALRVTTGSIQYRIKTSATGYVYTVVKNNNAQDNYFTAIGQVTAGRVAFDWGGWKIGTISINDGLRHFVTLACSGSTTDIFVDGRLDTQQAFTMFRGTSAWAPFYIGYRAYDWGQQATWDMSLVTFKNHRVGYAENKNQWAFIKGFF